MRERDADATEIGSHALRWYGWGSPVGLGLFILLVSSSIALIVRLAFR